MNLPKITDLDLQGKKVILRLDLDLKEFDENDLRIKSSLQTLDYLKEKNCQITIIAHRGRPNGVDESLSLKSFQPYFDKWGAKLEENLRFEKGEEENSLEFSEKLSKLGEVYINEAFASSHRSHSSIIGLPKILPHAAGFRFLAEVENLSREFEKPVVSILSGVKEDKLQYLEGLEKISDKILVGGRLPLYLGDNTESVRTQEGKRRVVGNLIMDKEDITLNTIDIFEKEIESAKTIILAGPLGRFEDEGHRQGTARVFKKVCTSSAFKLAMGGDTEAAIKLLGLDSHFDWISVGGGAALQFLTSGTLPAITALLE